MSSPDFSQRHPSYERFKDRWQLMRDSIEGPERIKKLGETYLPKPEGMKDPSDPDYEKRAYSNYKTRAQYPDIVAPTVRAMTGVIHRDESRIELPAGIEGMLEKATPDGLSAQSLLRRITRELLSVGRCGLLPDVGDDGEPYIAIYRAEDSTNWHESEDGVDLVVLDESTSVIDLSTFSWEDETRHRVLRLDPDSGRYFTQEWVGEDGQQEGEDRFPQARGGNPLESIPFVFVDTNDLTPEPDEVPLAGMAEVALGIYRLDADYRKALFTVSEPQPWTAGVDPEYAPKVWGGGFVWNLGDKDASAGMLEYQGTGIADQRQAIVDDFARAAQMGAQMFDQERRESESGEALKIRQGAKTATLASIAKTAASALEQALKRSAEFAGANPDEVEVDIDTDFIDRTLGAQEMQAITQAAQGGNISKQTAYEQMQAGGRANPERNWEDEQELIEADAPTGFLGRE
jgi:hypothetical protein